jgi:hypothetical protein
LGLWIPISEDKNDTKKKDCKQCKVLLFAEQEILPEELAASIGA